MPTYEYYCKTCDKDFEVFQSITADPLTDCPECDASGQVERRISGGAGIIFKGSGFYETDYKSKSGKSDNTSESASSSSCCSNTSSCTCSSAN
ncbi:MAG: zinc ribbon domain-containing protein [Verrucomicrobiota bacterium]